MPDSDITVSTLTATPGVSTNKLAWVLVDPNASGPFYLRIDKVEIWSSITNDRTTAVKVVEGIVDALDAGLFEEVTYYYWIKPRNQAGNYGDWYPSSPTAGVAGKTRGTAGLAFGLANAKIVAAVAANALTVAIKTAAGNDPSVSDPVFVAFRNVSLSDGSYQVRQITSALSFIIPAGSDMGCAVNDPFRIWVAIFDDGGTLRLAVRNCSGSTGAIPFPDSEIASALPPTPAGSRGQFFTNATVTSKSFRPVGFLDWFAALATPGQWDTAPNALTLFGAGTHKPGETIDVQTHESIAVATGTTVIPYDDTIPQRTEGDNYLNGAVTPASPSNLIRHTVLFNCAHSSGANPIIAALFYQSGFGTADALAASINTPPAANLPTEIRLEHMHRAGSSSAIGFQVNAGCNTAGTLTVNGAGGVRKLGGVLSSTWTTEQVMG